MIVYKLKSVVINSYESGLRTCIHWFAFLSKALLGLSECIPHRHWNNSLLLVAADSKNKITCAPIDGRFKLNYSLIVTTYRQQ